jgi:hypothetical protein
MVAINIMDEKTKIPFTWIVVSMPFIIGGIFWLASVDTKASEAREQLSSVDKKLIDIRERLIRIEDTLLNR